MKKFLIVLSALVIAASAVSVAMGAPPKESPPAKSGPVLTAEQTKALGSMSEAKRKQILDAVAQLAPGAKMEVEIVDRDEGVTHTIEFANGTGAGVESDADKLSDQFTGSAPNTALPGGASAQGGGAQHKVTAEQKDPPPSAWSNPFLYLGLLCFAVAGGLFYFRVPNTKEAIPILLGAGVVCEAIVFYPALLIWGAIGVVVVLLVAYVKSKKDHVSMDAEATKWWEALRAAMAGVHDASIPPQMQAQVMAAIKARSETKNGVNDTEAIMDVLKDDELGPFKPA